MKQKIIIAILVFIDFLMVISILVSGNTVALLSPQGFIAEKQRDLIIFAIVLASTVVVPVFLLYLFVITRFRADKSKSASDSGRQNTLIQLSWWVIPTIIIFILAIVALKDTHALDPYKPIYTTGDSVKIQVVALRWKWLFIYPEHNIATLNYIQFPVGTPLEFELTADAPMNSFWIPQLGGQIYAMSGMSTSLHLIADNEGVYDGAAAEISGSGFSKMRFKAEATTREEFDSWVDEVQKSSNTLDFATYEKLVLPSENDSVTFFASPEHELYNKIMMKFMPSDKSSSHGMNH